MPRTAPRHDGVPHTILFDNMKTVLIDRNAYGPGQHRFHAGFREFAKHHGFSPRMCAPYPAIPLSPRVCPVCIAEDRSRGDGQEYLRTQ